MNLDWVIPCRYVEVHDNLGTIIGAGIDTVAVPQLPAPVQVLLAIRLTATGEELTSGEEHAVRNVITNPGGDVIGDEGGPFQATMENPRMDWLNAMVVSAVVVFQADEEGTYAIEHQLDQSHVSIPIHVVHQPPGFAPPE